MVVVIADAVFVPTLWCRLLVDVCIPYFVYMVESAKCVYTVVL